MSDKAAVVIGASAGVGRAMAEKLARDRFNLVLVSKGRRDLEAMAGDLSLRFGIRCSPLEADLARMDLDPAVFLDECLKRLNRLDAVFYVAGYITPEDEGLANDVAGTAILCVNYVSAVRLLGAFARYFEAQRAGHIVGFSSIAASAPRGRNMVYASAKAGLEVYLRALRHYLAGKRVIVQCYVLGYVDTAMTFDKKLLLPKASPSEVADAVLRNLGLDRGVIYFPAFWQWVTWALNRLPWFLYRRLSF